MEMKLTTFEDLCKQAMENNTDVPTMFSILCSNEQSEKFKKIMQQTKNEGFFSVKGRFFKGNRYIETIKYILAEPAQTDFLAWCDNNCDIYLPLK